MSNATVQSNRSLPWGQSQINSWHQGVVDKKPVRNYHTNVVERLSGLPANTHYYSAYGSIGQVGLYKVQVGNDFHKPTILLTAGVHGYEPSGVEAVLEFLEQEAPSLSKKFNIVAYPCISPWAYEFDQRWNVDAQDPNRYFSRSPGIPDVLEARYFMDSVESLLLSIQGGRFACAIDLHETSNRDIELRQLRAARFGTPLESYWQEIPQGFYLTLTEGDNSSFGQSIVDAVSVVSPIASEALVLNKPNLNGIIYSKPSDGLMRTYLKALCPHVAVTEVNPDAPNMDHRKAVEAQRAAIRGAIDYLFPAA